MKEKLFIACSLLALLCGCQQEPATEEPQGTTPQIPGKQQLVETLNTNLKALKTLSGASVSELTQENGMARVMLIDGSQIEVVCTPQGAAPLIGVASEGDDLYWTLAALPGQPWLTDAQGERMPVSGSLPLAGIDEQGYWTLATAVGGDTWRIVDASGNPVAASADQPVALFRALSMVDGQLSIQLTDGGEVTAQCVTDLSANATANCYVVSAPGRYLFDASVRGNGVGDVATAGLTPQIAQTEAMTAEWLWVDQQGLLSDVTYNHATGDIIFTLGEARGNGLIALFDGDAIVWSWHIWATESPQTMVYENGVEFADRNLGATGTTVGGTDAYGLYYQWGRKDPFYGGYTTETSAEAFKQAAANTIVNPKFADLKWGAATGAFSTAAYGAANPMTFLYNKIGVSSNFDWQTKPCATMWGAAKNLNDPCPPGYKVPAIDAWENLCANRQYIEGVSAWDGVNYGMTYTYGGKTAWYPAQGSRNYNTGSLIGLATTRSGQYWSSNAASQTSSYFYFQKKLSTSSGSINLELDKSRSYGYTVRCCRE